MKDIKEAISELLSRHIKLEKEKIQGLLEVPPDPNLGDYAFPCFILAKEFKKSPAEIAKELSEKISKAISKEISEVKAINGYLNFFVNKNLLVESITNKILKENYGKSSFGKGKKIVIDMSSPNIAKPFGIGHLRSTIIGNSISKICNFLGFNTFKINYLGDWGTQFGKMIIGYKKFGNLKDLKKSPIKYMLELYVKGNKEEYEDEARQWFKKLEEGDKESLKLWKMFREISLKEFNKLYKIMGVKFDLITGESYYNNKMEAIIKELRDKNLLEKSEGAEGVNLKKYGLGFCLIRKSDGATLYATRDVTAAIDRYKKYKFHRMFYEVGQEQKLHFKQIFQVLELMGYPWSKDCIHIAHGLYLDKDGKKFATRKGKTIFMEDILKETIELAKKQLEKREKLSLKELEKRSIKIAIAAIFYGDLKNYRENDMIFDINKFLDFEGNTGPYLQYSYARANSILKKSRTKPSAKIKILNLHNKEIELAKKLLEFPQTIEHAYNQLNPSIIANYSFQLCQIFNEFYHECPVIQSREESQRLGLVKAFMIVQKSALSLLGIDVLEEM